MEDNKVYQFFSLRTGQFLKATRKHVRADGTDERCIESKSLDITVNSSGLKRYSMIMKKVDFFRHVAK